MLLVWAANLIKLYACSKKLGDTIIDTVRHNTSINIDEV